jgi:integrase
MIPTLMFGFDKGKDLARRRLQKDGHLFKKNGWWKLRWREDDTKADGQRYRARRTETIGRCDGPSALTERQAKREAWDRILSKVNQVELTPQSLMKFRDFVDKFFIPGHVVMLKIGGRVHYDVNLKHVLGELGNKPLRDIKHHDVQGLCLGMLTKSYAAGGKQKRYSVQTALHVKNVASAVFEHAKQVGMYVGENPAKYVKLPEMQRKERHALTAEQMKLLLEALPSPAREMAHLAVLTSMNIAEICGLQWCRVNLTDGWAIVDGEPIPPQCIAVRRQWSARKGGGAYGTVKAKGRVRNLPLTAALSRLLRSVTQGRQI